MTPIIDPGQNRSSIFSDRPERGVIPMTFVEPLMTSCTGSVPRDCKHGRSGTSCDDCKVRLFSVCGALEPSELDQLDSLSQVRNFPVQTMLFDQGALASSVF